ncbi:twin-arginine translocase TatA/TatE family subunit [Sorangium sp. So ce134]
MGRIGPLEIALLIGLALLLFGAGRIADIGKGIGEGIRNFKKGIRDDEEEDAAKQLPPKPDAKEEDTQKPV